MLQRERARTWYHIKLNNSNKATPRRPEQPHSSFDTVIRYMAKVADTIYSELKAT